MKRICIVISTLFWLSTLSSVFGQDTLYQKLTIPDLHRLALANNQQLKISRMGIGIASQRVEVVKTLRNPVLTATFGAAYLGDASVLSTDFSEKTSVPMPHFANSFALQASQAVFRGGVIENNIRVAGLQEQLASLSNDRNQLDIKLLVTGNYLDLFRLYSQRQVYGKNIQLAQLRLNNINKMHERGMVTRNDVIRTELLITNLGTAVKQINNNIAILSQQLNIALALPENTFIVPDTTILAALPIAGNLDAYLDFAYQNYPDIKAAGVNTRIAETNVQISKADKLPVISLVAGNTLARPITTSRPAIDMYSNGWQAGVSASYNISSLYNANKKIRQSRMIASQQQQMQELQRQNIENAVKTAFIKNREANQVRENALKSMELAEENFRIVEKKYYNQLALLIDVVDATNTRLDAELQKTNAEINIIYTWYQLQKETGNL